MLVASDKLKIAIDSDERYITPTVKIYFDGPDQEPMIFSEDDIIDINIVEEIANETDTPIGNVCSNELNLELLNKNHIFTLTNKDSILSGKILPNVKCEVLFNVYVDDMNFETIKMGTFYLEDCKSSSNTLSTIITAYDRLYGLYDLTAPDIPIQHNIRVNDLFGLFFNKLGLSKNKDYIIDDSLSSIINIAWLEDSKVGNCIKSLSTSCACIVYVNRNNQIVVKDQLKLNKYDYVLSEDTQISDIVNVPAYNEMCSSVELEYNIPSVNNDMVEVLNISEFTLQPGINKLSNLKFSKSPVQNITGIEVIQGSNVFIYDYLVNANSMDLELNNMQGQEQTVSIKVYGITIDLTTAYIIKKDDELVNTIGERPMHVTSYLLQDNNISQEYTNVLLSMVTNFGSTMDIALRGNPLIEIADIINISAPTYSIVESVIPIKNTYSLSDGLSATMLCIKAENRTYTDIVFVSPGMIIESKR